jgi:hypothetical protein
VPTVGVPATGAELATTAAAIAIGPSCRAKLVVTPPDVSAMWLASVTDEESCSALLRAYANIAHATGDSGGAAGPGAVAGADPNAPSNPEKNPVTTSATAALGAAGCAVDGTCTLATDALGLADVGPAVNDMAASRAADGFTSPASSTADSAVHRGFESARGSGEAASTRGVSVTAARRSFETFFFEGFAGLRSDSADGSAVASTSVAPAESLP